MWGRVCSLQVNGSHVWAAGEEWVRDGDERAGVVLGSDDGGLIWTVQARTGEALTTVLMTDALHGFAFGEQGTALQTDDGGATWTPEDIGTDATLRTAVRLPGGAALVAGDGGVLLTAPAD